MQHKRPLQLLCGIVLLGCLGNAIFLATPRPVCQACLFDGGAASVASNSAKPGESGAVIEGRVIYEADPKRRWRYGRYYIKDRKKGELAEAVVGLRGKPLKDFPAPTENQTWNMDQKDVRFTPETLAIRAGDRVKFTNSDRQVHNINTNSPLVRFDRTISGDQEAVQTFDRAGGVKRPILLGCKLHSAMRAWIFVFDHPYFELTGADGSFRFEDVPPGEYRLEMSHPAGGLQRTRSITVKPGERKRLEIRVSPEHRVES